MDLVYTLEDVIEELNDIEGACDRVWFEMEYRKEKHLLRKTTKSLTVVVMIKYQLNDAKGLLEGKTLSKKGKKPEPLNQRDLPAYAKGSFMARWFGRLSYKAMSLLKDCGSR